MPLLIPKYGGLMTNTNGMEYYFEVHIFVNEDWFSDSEGVTKETLIFKPAEVPQRIMIKCGDHKHTAILDPQRSDIDHQVSDYSDLIPSGSYDRSMYNFQQVLIL